MNEKKGWRNSFRKKPVPAAVSEQEHRNKENRNNAVAPAIGETERIGENKFVSTRAKFGTAIAKAPANKTTASKNGMEEVLPDANVPSLPLNNSAIPSGFSESSDNNDKRASKKPGWFSSVRRKSTVSSRTTPADTSLNISTSADADQSIVKNKSWFGKLGDSIRAKRNSSSIRKNNSNESYPLRRDSDSGEELQSTSTKRDDGKSQLNNDILKDDWLTFLNDTLFPDSPALAETHELNRSEEKAWAGTNKLVPTDNASLQKTAELAATVRAFYGDSVYTPLLQGTDAQFKDSLARDKAEDIIKYQNPNRSKTTKALAQSLAFANMPKNDAFPSNDVIVGLRGLTDPSGGDQRYKALVAHQKENAEKLYNMGAGRGEKLVQLIEKEYPILLGSDFFTPLMAAITADSKVNNYPVEISKVNHSESSPLDRARKDLKPYLDKMHLEAWTTFNTNIFSQVMDVHYAQNPQALAELRFKAIEMMAQLHADPLLLELSAQLIPANATNLDITSTPVSVKKPFEQAPPTPAQLATCQKRLLDSARKTSARPASDAETRTILKEEGTNSARKILLKYPTLEVEQDPAAQEVSVQKYLSSPSIQNTPTTLNRGMFTSPDEPAGDARKRLNFGTPAATPVKNAPPPQFVSIDNNNNLPTPEGTPIAKTQKTKSSNPSKKGRTFDADDTANRSFLIDVDESDADLDNGKEEEYPELNITPEFRRKNVGQSAVTPTKTIAGPNDDTVILTPARPIESTSTPTTSKKAPGVIDARLSSEKTAPQAVTAQITLVSDASPSTSTDTSPTNSPRQQTAQTPPSAQQEHQQNITTPRSQRSAALLEKAGRKSLDLGKRDAAGMEVRHYKSATRANIPTPRKDQLVNRKKDKYDEFRDANIIRLYMSKSDFDNMEKDKKNAPKIEEAVFPYPRPLKAGSCIQGTRNAFVNKDTNMVIVEFSSESELKSTFLHMSQRRYEEIKKEDQAEKPKPSVYFHKNGMVDVVTDSRSPENIEKYGPPVVQDSFRKQKEASKQKEATESKSSWRHRVKPAPQHGRTSERTH